MRKLVLILLIISFQLAGAALAAYNSPVGSAEAWIWTNPTESIKVMSGSAESWSWQTWTSGSGRKVPQGSAEAWTWGNE